MTWYEECETEKWRKRWRNKRRGIRSFEVGEEKKYRPKVWGLVQFWRTAWVRTSRREKKNRESESKYTVKKRTMNEKKKRVFFFYSSCIFKCCNLYLIYIVKLFGVCPVIFSFEEKGFSCKSLCFCMTVLPLYLLKFIHSYIEFFPTQA